MEARRDNEFANLQARWDAGWYLTVAIDGYSYAPDRPLDQQDIVYFPAFPVLMRWPGVSLAAHRRPSLWAGR